MPTSFAMHWAVSEVSPVAISISNPILAKAATACEELGLAVSAIPISPKHVAFSETYIGVFPELPKFCSFVCICLILIFSAAIIAALPTQIVLASI